MRVLVTVDPEIPVPPLLYGGIERIVNGLVKDLRHRGHEVGLLAHPDSDCDADFFKPWPGSASTKWSDTVKNAFHLEGCVKRFTPHIVHSFSRLSYLLPMLRSRLPSIMSYQRHTGGLRHRVATKLGGERFVFTACSEFIARSGRSWGGTWFPIPNFVNTDFFKFRPTVSADAPLVFLSRIERIKGAHTAIAVARKAGRQLIIAGNRVNDVEGARYWRNEIEPHIDRCNVQYVGPVDDAQKNELLGTAAATIVPIEWDEPFGIVFAESLACGTPVVSCRRGALPEIVEDGVHGFLISSIEQGVDAVARLGMVSRSACRARAEQLFSQRVVVSQYERLYQQLASAT